MKIKLIKNLKNISINKLDITRAIFNKSIMLIWILLLGVIIVFAGDVTFKAGDFDISENLTVSGNANVSGNVTAENIFGYLDNFTEQLNENRSKNVAFGENITAGECFKFAGTETEKICYDTDLINYYTTSTTSADGHQFYVDGNPMMRVSYYSEAGGTIPTLRFPSTTYVYASGLAYSFATGWIKIPGWLYMTKDNQGFTFGGNYDGEIYYDGANMILNPDRVGSGSVLIGTTGENEIVVSTISSPTFINLSGDTLVEGDLNVTGKSYLGTFEIENDLIIGDHNFSATDINITNGTDNGFYFDYETNKIGIGTNTPTHELNVEGTTNLSGNTIVEGNLSVTGNITAENVFIPQYIFSHTNRTQTLLGANEWTNVTFDQEDSDIKQGISHTWNDNTNHTFMLMEAGVYEADFDFDMEDASEASSDIDVAGRLVYINGTEISGSVFETDIQKKGVEAELSHDFLFKCKAGDSFMFQFVANNENVQISTHGTFGDHPESATVVIKKVANL